MKAKSDSSVADCSRFSQRDGVALVLVLGFLVIISILVVAFFSSVSVEYRGAKRYAGEMTAKQLADSAVQTVMGTIKLATSGSDAGAAGTLAWASQPGMIRTYGSDGALVKCFKLYSSDVTVKTGISNFDPGSDNDTDWATKPALFTDLNAPVISGTKALFPILDGNGITTLSRTSVSGTAPAPYLGYDSNSDGLPDVEGFAVDPNKVSFNSGVALSSTNTPVPMPVKWIYVLQDGTQVSPDSTSSTVATFNNAPEGHRPSETNPITGRIAFWTDDETCKVNINTASEGTYWDTPISNSSEDKNYAKSQPVNHEFQRYPGHPATTSLSPVFSKLWSGTDAVQNEQIYAITPRIGGGGSLGGTVVTGTGSTNTAITLDSDRLYASVDELLFQPALTSGSRSSQGGLTNTLLDQSRFFITANSRSPDVNLFNKPRVCIWPISSTSGTDTRTTFDNLFAFCSTTGTNTYYFQRSDQDTSADLPTVSSMTGLGRNRMLLEYLRTLTKTNIPGFGGTLHAKYATPTGVGNGTDCDQILTEMVDYIHCLNMRDTGVKTKFTTSIDPYNFNKIGQVVPLVDSSTGTRGIGRFPTIDKAFFMFIGNAVNPIPATSGSDLLLYSGTYNAATSGSNGVLPGRTRISAGLFFNIFTPMKGYVYLYPRFTIKVSGLQNVSFGTANPTTISNAQIPSGSGTTTGVITTQRVTMASGSFTASTYYSSMALNGYAIGPDQSYLYSFHDFDGGNMGFQTSVLGFGWNIQGYNGGAPYPFVKSTATTTSTNGGVTVTTSDLLSNEKLYFNASGPITVSIYNAKGDTLVQTINLNFPSSGAAGGWPIPNLSVTSPETDAYLKNGGTGTPTGYNSGNFRYFVTGTTPYITGPATGSSPVTLYGGRLSSAQNGRPHNNWILETDVVRSLEIASGDPRLAAACAVVSSTMFAPHANYNTQNKMAHSLRTPTGYPYYGATVGPLVKGLPLCYPYSSGTVESNNGTSGYGYQLYHQAWDLGIPATAITTGSTVMVGGATGSSTVQGDWDNGYGNTPDGPYVNKPDEGAVGNVYGLPYYETQVKSYNNIGSMFSPNRQIPSAVMFGSLPTGVFANSPWQTLLFRPLPIGHPGLGVSVLTGSSDSGPPYTTPPDHLFLDLFNMPVVEPYPISEPLSTAGRINMNYQIAPFTYITRNTGIRAVLKSEEMVAISDGQSAAYKGGTSGGISSYTPPSSIRFPVNMDQTLVGFSNRFSSHDIFRSPSEICSINMVPLDTTDTNATYGGMPAYWATHRLTGDNSRERIYATVYPRLTTKSNTYTVHFRVQTLQKSKGTSATQWDERKDAVVSEYRGSQTIERYVDPNDPNIPDYASGTATTPIDVYYRFRVLNSKRFGR